MKELKTLFLDKEFNCQFRKYFKICKKIQIEKITLLISFLILFLLLFLIQILLFAKSTTVSWVSFLFFYALVFYTCTIYLVWYLIILHQINSVLSLTTKKTPKHPEQNIASIIYVYEKLSVSQFTKKTIEGPINKLKLDNLYDSVAEMNKFKDVLWKIIFFLPYYWSLFFCRFGWNRIHHDEVVAKNYKKVTNEFYKFIMSNK